MTLNEGAGTSDAQGDSTEVAPPAPDAEIPAGDAAGPNLMTLYLRDVRRFDRLPVEQELQLLASLDDGCDDAREALICHHLGLVIAMARHFNHRGLDLLDLIEEGNLGMLVALDKFEAQRGLRFSTYAAWWIRYYLQTAIATQVPIVRPPLRAQQRARRQAWQQWCESHGAQAPMAESSMVTRLPIDDADIDAHFAEAGLHHRDTLHEASDRYDTPRLATLLRRQVEQLPQRQRDIIVARFGLDGNDECTLQQLSAEWGVSRERIRQLEAAALRTLREALMGEGVSRDAALE